MRTLLKVFGNTFKEGLTWESEQKYEIPSISKFPSKYNNFNMEKPHNNMNEKKGITRNERK